jgi:hypothetical protein
MAIEAATAVGDVDLGAEGEHRALIGHNAGEVE